MSSGATWSSFVAGLDADMHVRVQMTLRITACACAARMAVRISHDHVFHHMEALPAEQK